MNAARQTQFGISVPPRKSRLRACEELSVEPRCEALPDDIDPVAYVLSLNLERRHLNESQRALVAAKLCNISAGGFHGNQHVRLRSIDHDQKMTPVTLADAAAKLNQRRGMKPRLRWGPAVAEANHCTDFHAKGAIVR